jgi:hypothetical protein
LNPSDALVQSLALACPELEVLHLSSANPFLGNALLTDAAIVDSIAARMTNMKQLNLQGSSNVTDACIASLVKRLPLLEKLNLGGCFKLTDAAVRTLCRVEEGGEDESFVQAVAAAAVMVSPSPTLPPRQAPSRLSHLSLFQCSRLTDASVALLAVHLPALQHLDLHSCAALTDRALEVLAQRTTQKDEEAAQYQWPSASLDDDDLPSASSDAAAEFALPQLLSLDVGSCRKMTAAGVAALKQARPSLIITHY